MLRTEGSVVLKMRLKDKVVIVTGSRRGLGKAYALALAKEGASVVVTDIVTEGLDEAVAEIEKQGGKAVAVKVDVSSEADTKRLAEETVKKFGRIDVLVNNAAYFSALKRRPFFEIDVEEWDKVLSVNLRGVWLCTKAVFPYMKSQSSGKIVNISSGTFFNGSPGFAHYVSAKGGVIGLTRALSRELGQYNITVNSLAPGYTVTEATISMDNEEYRSRALEPRTIKRNEVPSDLVGPMLFLCSEESDFMTGQTILVDGGRGMH
ncbi:MAG: SDR family NAD(P)-dependent oxidoreductase [Nitrososphaerales archaeon]